ncbi:MAG: HPF/RaiA family ribosome-associated protein [Alphaproteobacteria bacterium]
MQTPVEIVFHKLERSEAVEARVRERVERLERFHPRITSCHVYIDAAHRNAQKKSLEYQVRVEVRVPGTELAVSSKPGDVNAHGDVYIAIRDTFVAMERQLKRSRRQTTGEVKTHLSPLQGTVAELHPDRDHGQIATTDGRLVYFHRNSVVNGGFDALSEGATVELSIQHDESDKGPQASTVRQIGPMRFVDEPR